MSIVYYTVQHKTNDSTEVKYTWGCLQHDFRGTGWLAASKIKSESKETIQCTAIVLNNSMHGEWWWDDM